MNTKNTLITLTKKLINQPSITPNDHNCQKIIGYYLKSLNFNIEKMDFFDTCNIWAYRCGYIKNQQEKKQYTLLFLGHTDVVSPGNIKDWKFPPFSGIINNGKLYGRGASDMKGALAAMLVATSYFIKKYPNYIGKIAFLITSDEEGTGINGTKKVIKSLINRNEHVDYCIVGEPSSLHKLGDVIKNGRRGSYTGKLIIHGESGHTAYPQFLKNPIHLSIPIISELLNTIWDQKTSIFFPPTSIQITNIYSTPHYSTDNVTPKQLVLNLNFRFNDQSSTYYIKNIINKILSNYHVSYHIDWKPVSQPYFSDPGLFTDIVINIIKKYQKITPKLETTGGTSDARFLKNIGTIEIIELGALNHTIHKANEYIKLTDLKLLFKMYLEIMKKILL